MARRPRTPTSAAPYPPGWEPFLAAVNADLDDDTARLVFADWLQEHGDEPRAQFVRLQCAAARSASDANASADALLAEHQPRWLIGLPKSVRENHGRFSFRRGFVAALEVRGRDLASTSPRHGDWDANAVALRRVTALEELHIDQVWNTVVETAALEGLRGLSLSSAGSGLIESLAKSPALPSLTALTILAKSSDGVSQQSFRRLLASQELARLRRLRIAGMRLGNLVAECLGAPHFEALNELRLLHLSIGAPGVRALAGLPAARRLRVLDLFNNPIGDDGLAELLAAPALQNLEELSLGRCGLTSASARLLAGWSGLRSVRKLNLMDNRMRRADAELIAASPDAVGLTDFEAPLRS